MQWSAFYVQKHNLNIINFFLPDEIGLKSAPTIAAPGEEVGMALGNNGLAGPPWPCIMAI